MRVPPGGDVGTVFQDRFDAAQRIQLNGEPFQRTGSLVTGADGNVQNLPDVERSGIEFPADGPDCLVHLQPVRPRGNENLGQGVALPGFDLKTLYAVPSGRLEKERTGSASSAGSGPSSVANPCCGSGARAASCASASAVSVQAALYRRVRP